MAWLKYVKATGCLGAIVGRSDLVAAWDIRGRQALSGALGASRNESLRYAIRTPWIRT